MSQRSKVIALYKHLQYLGREYPAGPEKFRIGCKKAFQKNSKELDPGTIVFCHILHCCNAKMSFKFNSTIVLLLFYYPSL